MTRSIGLHSASLLIAFKRQFNILVDKNQIQQFYWTSFLFISRRDKSMWDIQLIDLSRLQSCFDDMTTLQTNSIEIPIWKVWEVSIDKLLQNFINVSMEYQLSYFDKCNRFVQILVQLNNFKLK